MMHVGASETGWLRSEALARALLMLENEALAASVHAGASEGLLVCFRSELRGWMDSGSTVWDETRSTQ